MWTIMRIVGLLAALLVATDAVPYSKYGRTCKDIGCLPSETCVMAEDPCTGYGSDSCGRYPTCTKSSKSCTTIVCPAGQYCKTQNGQPTCVSKDLGPVAARNKATARPYVPPAPRPTPPTPPPRSSSFGHRQSGQSGNRNTIGSGSIWDRLFGGEDSGGRTRPSTSLPRGGFDSPTRRPTSTYPGGKDYYTSHTSRDAQGNRQWTFSG